MKSIEQKRAAHAWEKCQKYGEKEANIAKGLPALIMNSGLMQVLAFCHQKGGEHKTVAEDLQDWLRQSFPLIMKTNNFEACMEALFHAEPATFQAISAEAFAWLRWMRQMASARLKAAKGG